MIGRVSEWGAGRDGEEEGELLWADEHSLGGWRRPGGGGRKMGEMR